MKYHPALVGGIALSLLLTAASDLRAELVVWHYSWSRSPTEVPADSPGTGYISLTDESEHKAVGTTDIVATNLTTHSTATADSPDTFTNRSYALTLNLFDESGQAGALTFTGEFNGTLTDQSSNITNTFTGQLTQSVVLGDHLYTAAIGPYASPGPPTDSNRGSISAHAVVTVQTLPEPGGLTLSCLGAALALVRWRRVRRHRAA